MFYNISNRVLIKQKVRKKKKTSFNARFQYSLSKITGLNKRWSLKRLAMLNCVSCSYIKKSAIISNMRSKM